MICHDVVQWCTVYLWCSSNDSNSNATCFTYIVSYLYTCTYVYTYDKYIDGNSPSGYLDKVYIRLLRLEMMCGTRLPCSWTNSSAEIDRNWMNIRTSHFSRIDDVWNVFFACWICMLIWLQDMISDMLWILLWLREGRMPYWHHIKSNIPKSDVIIITTIPHVTSKPYHVHVTSWNAHESTLQYSKQDRIIPSHVKKHIQHKAVDWTAAHQNLNANGYWHIQHCANILKAAS